MQSHCEFFITALFYVDKRFADFYAFGTLCRTASPSRLVDRSGKLPFLIRIFDGDFCAFGTILSIIVVLRCCSNQDEKRIFHSRQFKCGVILNEGAC
jgi:hypothetical protein